MGEACAELVFVSGPQSGRRVAVMGDQAVVGRSPTADVPVKEQFASREHVRLVLTPQGWVMRNLSANGTLVNGRTYKSTKKEILLATGDVLGIGTETQVLFVSPGDDADEALDAYRQENPLPEATKPQLAAEAGAQAPSEPAAAMIPPPEGGPGKGVEQAPPAVEQPVTVAVAPEEAEAEARRAKIKKYAIGGAIYLCVMVAAVIFFTSLGDGDGPGGGGKPKLLDPKAITRAITAKVERARNPVAAAEALRQALAYWRDRGTDDGNPYRSYRCFKMHLAFSHSATFENVEHEALYQRAESELIQTVQGRYRNAYALEQAGNWHKAVAAFEELRRMVPAKGRPYPESRNILFDNITKHLTYVREKSAPREQQP